MSCFGKKQLDFFLVFIAKMKNCEKIQLIQNEKTIVYSPSIINVSIPANLSDILVTPETTGYHKILNNFGCFLLKNSEIWIQISPSHDFLGYTIISSSLSRAWTTNGYSLALICFWEFEPQMKKSMVEFWIFFNFFVLKAKAIPIHRY